MPETPPKLPSIWKGGCRSKRLGAVAEAYGAAWVAEWNRHVTAEGIGRP